MVSATAVGRTNVVWDTNWFAVSDGGFDFRDYYELAGPDVAADGGSGIGAPQAENEGGAPINLYNIGSKAVAATVRGGFLWTCHTVGLSGTNGTYSGDDSGTNVDRVGVQWLKAGVDASGGSLSYSDHGRVYDRPSSNAVYYYYPSLMMNCPGDMVVGFSGSSASHHIGAYYSWRTVSGGDSALPRLIRAGITNYQDFPAVRLGDYSATSLDPTDDWSFWTVQQYADSSGVDELGRNLWRTVIARLRPDR